MFILLLYLFLALVTIAALSLFVWVFRLRVPPMPSSSKMRDALVAEVARHPHRRRVVDLGAGWGGLAAAIARAHPDREVLGFEISLIPFLVSLLRLTFAGGPKNLRFQRVDFRRFSPEDQTLYLAYLSPIAMEQLRRRFEERRPENSALVSPLFGVRRWTAARRNVVNDLHRTAVYVYDPLPG